MIANTQQNPPAANAIWLLVEVSSPDLNTTEYGFLPDPRFACHLPSNVDVCRSRAGPAADPVLKLSVQVSRQGGGRLAVTAG